MLAQEKTRLELVGELESSHGKKVAILRNIAKSRQDVVGKNCVKDPHRKIVTACDHIKEV